MRRRSGWLVPGIASLLVIACGGSSRDGLDEDAGASGGAGSGGDRGATGGSGNAAGNGGTVVGGGGAGGSALPDASAGGSLIGSGGVIGAGSFPGFGGFTSGGPCSVPDETKWENDMLCVCRDAEWLCAKSPIGGPQCTNGETRPYSCGRICTCSGRLWQCSPEPCDWECQTGQEKSDGCNMCTCGDDHRYQCTQNECKPGREGTPCGGYAGDTCSDAEYCDIPPVYKCGLAGSTGRCKPRPAACGEIYDPACACDRSQYDNACEANRAGKSVSEWGRCPLTP